MLSRSASRTTAPCSGGTADRHAAGGPDGPAPVPGTRRPRCDRQFGIHLPMRRYRTEVDDLGMRTWRHDLVVGGGVRHSRPGYSARPRSVSCGKSVGSLRVRGGRRRKHVHFEQALEPGGRSTTSDFRGARRTAPKEGTGKRATTLTLQADGNELPHDERTDRERVDGRWQLPRTTRLPFLPERRGRCRARHKICQPVRWRNVVSTMPSTTESTTACGAAPANVSGAGCSSGAVY